MNRIIPPLVYLFSLVMSLAMQGGYRVLVILLLVTSVVSMVDRLGKGLALRESIAFMYILTCVAMPILGYDFYNSQFFNARVLDYTMQVPEKEYYAYVLPAVSAFCFALMFPMPAGRVLDEGSGLEGIIRRCKAILDRESHISIVIMFSGIGSFLLTFVLPMTIEYVGFVMFLSCFAGLLYVHFTPNRENKRPVLISFAILLLGYSITVGMFTILIYMGITISSFLLLGVRFQVWKKFLLAVSIIFLVVVLQNTKGMYRKVVFYSETENQNKVELFTDLFIQNLQAGRDLFQPNTFWTFYMRANQGMIISNVMERFPVVKPFDNGKILLNSLLASFIPRFLWRDKSTADGRFNMSYYAGRELNRQTSMNVGPVGEAYGSFGPSGGILFMFFIGAFIRFLYGRVLMVSLRYPLVLLWIPVVFYNITYSAETDSMQIMNSSIKVSFMMWLIYKVMPIWFGVRKRTDQTARMQLGST